MVAVDPQVIGPKGIQRDQYDRGWARPTSPATRSRHDQGRVKKDQNRSQKNGILHSNHVKRELGMAAPKPD
jgi:hypothetical protein